MIADFPAAADGVNELLARRMREGLCLEIDIDAAHELEDVECEPVHEEDQVLAVHVRHAAANRGEDGMEDVVDICSSTRDKAGAAGDDLAALEEQHCRHAEKRNIEN